MAQDRIQRKLAAILAADVVGYTRLMEADEAETLVRLKALRDELIDPRIEADGGRIVKVMGDGVLVEFPSAVDAVRTAIAIQQAMETRNAGEPDDMCIEFRVGVNLGDVIIDGDDIHGDGVNVAARLEGLCAPGEVYVSGSVFDQVTGKLAAAFDDLGEKSVKNMTRPIRVYRAKAKAEETMNPIDPDAPLPLPDKPSIAVLPFENMSGDPEQEYFSDGITEDIITELTKISGLFVIARHSSFVYKGKQVNLKQVGRDLGVRYVLEGSVRKAGNRLRITAQLIDSMTDHHQWVERYDRDLEDVFAVQDEVARKVAEALAVALKPDEGERLGQIPIADIEVYDLYLKVRATPWPPTRENILTARNAYERIGQIAPAFAGGYAGQSMTYSIAVLFARSERAEEDAAKALELAQRAVTLDEGFAPSHSALGLAYAVSHRHDEGIAAARRAVELQPGNADAHADLARCLMFAGHGDEACDSVKTAHRLDPQYVAGPYLNLLGRASFVAGKYEQAIEAHEHNMDRGGPLGAIVLARLAACYALTGRMEDADRTTRRLLDHTPRFSLAQAANLYMAVNRNEDERMLDGLRKAGLPE